MEVKTNQMQEQIDQMNQKLDLVLQYVNDQRLKSESIEDLIADLSIIGKDAFSSTVDELDNRGIELNIDDIKLLLFKLIRNVNNFSQLMDMFESLNDLLKDIGPMVNEMGVDFTYKLHEFEQKGYFEFFRAFAGVADKIITRYSPEDINKMGNQLILVLDTLKNTELSQDKKYTLWKLMKEANSTEMKQSLGWMITLIKNLSKNSKNQ